FHLGGDSILAIQLVSRARKAGLVFSPRDLFRYQTPEALAPVAKSPETVVLPASMDEAGAVVPTPIIHALLEQNGPFRQFHQSVLLQVPAGLQKSDLLILLQSLIDIHACLRLRLEPNNTLRITERGTMRAEDCVSIAGGTVDSESG